MSSSWVHVVKARVVVDVERGALEFVILRLKACQAEQPCLQC